MHIQQGFVGDVGDVELGIAGFGNVQGFLEGATRGFAVVDGDENIFVHGCSPENY
jgi:hypothetical protein